MGEGLVREFGIYMCVRSQSLSRVQLFETPGTVGCQASLPMGFSRQEYWSGQSFPSPGDLPDPAFKPGSPAYFRQILYGLSHHHSTKEKAICIPERI